MSLVWLLFGILQNKTQDTIGCIYICCIFFTALYEYGKYDAKRNGFSISFFTFLVLSSTLGRGNMKNST